MNEFDWAPLAEVQLIRLADENARLFGVGGGGRGAGAQWARGAKKSAPQGAGYGLRYRAPLPTLVGRGGDCLIRQQYSVNHSS